MVNQNKLFSFKIKRQAKKAFPIDVERTVGISINKIIGQIHQMTSWWIHLPEQIVHFMRHLYAVSINFLTLTLNPL